MKVLYRDFIIVSILVIILALIVIADFYFNHHEVFITPILFLVVFVPLLIYCIIKYRNEI